MHVYVMTSDKYIAAIRPFFWLFNKYWSPDQPVTVVGFTPPDFEMPPNFDFLSLGAFEDYPVTQWSDALIKLLSIIPDKPFVLLFEDYWLTKKVHTPAVKMLYDYAKQFGYVYRLDLTGDRLNAGGAKFYGTCGDIELVWSDPESQYHMSLMTAIWNPRNLRRVLILGETPWQVELEGTTRLRMLGDHALVLGTTMWPVRHTLAFRGGDSGTLLLDDVAKEDVEELTKLGYLKPWGLG